MVSAARASGYPIVNVQPLVGTLAKLGMPLYGCQTPDGYKNTEAAWLNPEGMTRRINFATALASGRLPIDREPPLLGKGATMRRTLEAIAMPASQSMQQPMQQTMQQTMQQSPSSQPQPQATAPLEGRGPALQAASLLGTLGPTISDKTRNIALSGEPQLAAALVLGSPDFMRR